MRLKCLLGIHHYKTEGVLNNGNIPMAVTIYDECQHCGATRNLRYADLTKIFVKSSKVRRFLVRVRRGG